MRPGKLTLFIPLVQIFVVGLLVFWPTFGLYINADNWIVLWSGETTIGTALPWTGWTTYFSPYGMSFMLMFLISKLFGYVGTPYYVISFLLRFMATSGLYIFLRNIQIAKPTALIVSILFIVSPFGLEVTDWVFQMTSYISIFFLLITLVLLLKLNKLRNVALAIFTLFLCVVVNPIRAHGIYLTIWLNSFFAFLISKQKRLIALFIALSIILFVFLLTKYTFGDPGPTSSMLKPGTNMIGNSLVTGDYSFIGRFFANLGEGILPTNYYLAYSKLSLTQKLFLTYRPGVEILFLISAVMAFLIFWKRYLLKKGRYVIFLGSMGILVLSYGLNKVLLGTNLTIESRLSAVLGFAFLVEMLMFSALDFYFKEKTKFRLDLIIVSISVFFVLLPWIHNPLSYLHTHNRYMIFYTIIAPLVVGDFINSIERRRWLGYIFAIGLIVSFSMITVAEINAMRFRHHKYYGEKIWSQIDEQLANEDLGDGRSVFYFRSANPERLHNLVISSFPYRMGLYYQLWEETELPYAIDNASDFKSMLSDGVASVKYIGKVHVYDRKDAYAFEIIDDVVYRLDIDELLIE